MNTLQTVRVNRGEWIRTIDLLLPSSLENQAGSRFQQFTCAESRKTRKKMENPHPGRTHVEEDHSES